MVKERLRRREKCLLHVTFSVASDEGAPLSPLFLPPFAAAGRFAPMVN